MRAIDFIQTPMYYEYKKENNFLKEVAQWSKLGEQDWVKRDIYRTFCRTLAYTQTNMAEIFNRLMIKKIFADACAAYLLGTTTEKEWLTARDEYHRQEERFCCYGSYNQKYLPLPE